MRHFVSTLMCAIAALAIAATSATARDCKSETIKATGDEVATQIVAYPNSLLAWRRAVRDAHGAEWNSWRYAQDRDIDCQRGDNGKWQCTRAARPCQDTLSTLAQGENHMNKKECKSEPTSSYGRREKTEEKASEQAIWGWRLDTRKKLGQEWADWENANETDIDCMKKDSRHQCIAFAVACLSK